MKSGILLSFVMMIGVSLVLTEEMDPTHHNHGKIGEHSQALTLNDGQKWEADKPTREGMQAFQQSLSQFHQKIDSTQSVDPEQYQKLGKELQASLHGIFQKCSMTGPGHDELHKFLLPLIRDVKKLQDEKTDEHRKVLEDIHQHAGLFHNYFQ